MWRDQLGFELKTISSLDRLVESGDIGIEDIGLSRNIWTPETFVPLERIL